MPTANNDGINIYYEIEGTLRDGEVPLVLQHGLTQSIERWHLDGYVGPLRDAGFTLVIIDARGHGKSDKPHDKDAYASEAMVADALAVLDVLALPKVHFWGYSMGTRIGFGLGEAAPTRFASHILGGGHPYARTIDPASRAADVTPEAVAASFLKRIGVDLNTIPAKHRELLMRNDFFAIDAIQQSRPTLEHALPAMTAPSLIYAGENDAVHDQAKRAATAMPNAKFVSLPGLEHAAAFREAGQILDHAIAHLRGA